MFLPTLSPVNVCLIMEYTLGIKIFQYYDLLGEKWIKHELFSWIGEAEHLSSMTAFFSSANPEMI